MARTMKNQVTAIFFALISISSVWAGDRWSVEKAHQWYSAQRWLVGANFNPASAINQLEMWQAETFDPDRIDLELGWAKELGMNTMRVYLHNLLWEQDAEGIKKRMSQYLDIAEKHDISTMFVLFDSVWNPNPRLGEQQPPVPGVHNSGWVQSPGADRLMDKSQYYKLESYVKDIVGAFRDDNRVLIWDVWNEPSNKGGGNYELTPNKAKYVVELLPQVFSWARSMDPTQPLTSGVWAGDEWSKGSDLPEIEQIQLGQSDIISFHDYSWPEIFERRIRQLQTYRRPLMCTEYMARGNGSTFDNTLPLGKKHRIAMYNWGLVDGKTQTRFPWDSWGKPYANSEPTVWFHDVFRKNGTPYREYEIQLIKRLIVEANSER